MALSNSQYDSIMREYDNRRLRSRKLLDERKKEIYSVLPEYKASDDEIATISVQLCKKKLLGEENKLDELSDLIEELTRKKKLLLTEAGYSINYLEPVYVCPYCKDTGYIEREKCNCFKQAILDFTYEQTNIRQIIRDDTFDDICFDYQVNEDARRMQNAVKISMDFVKNFDSDYQNLYFYGNVGTGKTMLTNCIANEILEAGYSCIYFSAVSLFDRLSDYYFRRNRQDDNSTLIDDIYECDLLIIDDLGTEIVNAFVKTHLFNLINERHLRKKSTIISSNKEVDDLHDTYTDRIFSRIASNYSICHLSGTDVRIQIKRNKNRK